MKKIFSLLATMVLTIAMNAQKLPNAVYALDFEMATDVADFGGIQHGEGELRTTSDVRFGTYYQNCPSAPGTHHTNYLVVNQNGFKTAGEQLTDGFSIGFWVNATVQNTVAPQNSYLYSTLITAYDEAQVATNQWPLIDIRARKWIQVNTAGFWDDFPDNENVNGSNVQDVIWLAQNENDDSFDSNWHYVTVVFENYATIVKYYVDGNLANTWNTKADFGGENGFFTHLYKFTHLVIGGDCPWGLADMDAAFAYDDIRLYAKALSEDEINLIKNYKLGTLSEEESLAVAKEEFDHICSELVSFVGQISEAGFTSLGNTLNDFVINAVPEEETTEAYNSAITLIRTTLNNAHEIIDDYNALILKVDDILSWSEQTMYPGQVELAFELENAIPTKAELNNLTEIKHANEAAEAARIKYLYSQIQPEDNSGIDVTKMIQHPWFCDENAEPTVDDKGMAIYTVPSPADFLNMGGWENTCTVTSDYDCTTYYTQGRTTWNNFHSSNIADAILDIHQQLKNLKPGFYTVSGDMISSQPATDNHIYARTSDGTERVSPVFSGNGWDAVATGIGVWETLTTGKVYVGDDGQLLIGATSTTDGIIYSGWYCATNFKLRYFGETSDFGDDIEAKYEEVQALIASMILSGDRLMATQIVENIYNCDANAYEKVSRLTDAATTFGQWITAEHNFTAIQDLKELKSSISDETLADVVDKIVENMVKVFNAESTTYEDLASLTSIYKSFVSFSEVYSYAANICPDKTAAMVQELKNENIDSDTIDSFISELRNEIKHDFLVRIQNASSEMPVDATCLMKNPRLMNNTSAGWNGKTPTVNEFGAEFYNTNFEISQILTDMPAGKYTLKVKGFYRDGSNVDAEANYMNNAYKPNTNLFANTSAVSIQSWASDPAYEEPLTDVDDYTSDYELFYPNTMASAAEYLKNGHYQGNSLDFVLNKDGDIKLGISKTTKIDSDWTFFKDFELYYCGPSDEAIGDTTIYYVNCGNEEIYRETAFWTQFSEYYTVENNNTAHFKFVNYSDMVNNWDNWVLVSSNSERGSEGYVEYFAIRADAYGWGASHNEAGFTHAYDWSTYAKDMNGSFVDMFVTYKDNSVIMNATITTNAKDDTVPHKVYNYNYTSKTNIDAEAVIFFFTTEKGYMVGEDIVTSVENINTDVLQNISNVYNLNGQVVNEYYKGIVIENGHKVLRK